MFSQHSDLEGKAALGCSLVPKDECGAAAITQSRSGPPPAEATSRHTPLFGPTPAKAPARALWASLQSRWRGESNSGAPGRQWAQRGGKGHPERFRVSKNLLGTKWGQRVALTSSPFWEIIAVDHELLWGGFCVYPHWRYLLTFSWKPSLRSPLGTISISVTAVTEKTRRKNGARERGNGLGACLVLPVQHQTGHQMWPQKTFSPTVDNIYCIPVLVARLSILGWKYKFRQGAILLHLGRRWARKEIIPTGGRAKQVARRGVPKLLYEHGERMNAF